MMRSIKSFPPPGRSACRAFTASTQKKAKVLTTDVRDKRDKVFVFIHLTFFICGFLLLCSEKKDELYGKRFPHQKQQALLFEPVEKNVAAAGGFWPCHHHCHG
jgi:hypothetical protein